MNNLEKIIVFFILLILVIPYGVSQDANSKKEKTAIKSFFSVDATFGMSGRSEFDVEISLYEYMYGLYILDEPKFSYKTLIYGGDFIGGIQLNNTIPCVNLKMGLGIGYLFYKQEDGSLPYTTNRYMFPNTVTTHGIPLFFYLRNDFLKGKVAPYLDFKIGNNFLITKETVEMRDIQGSIMDEDYGKFRLKNGLYLASNIGVAFNMDSRKAINISIGYQYMSRAYDLCSFIFPNSFYDSDLKEYTKVGYTIIDHQFMFNVGISF